MRYFTLVTLLVISVVFIVYVLNSDYEYLSTELVYEATLHQDFYSDPNSYKSYLQVEQKMIERDLKSILYNKENLTNASSSYVFVVDRLTQGINIPLIPNIIALISILIFLPYLFIKKENFLILVLILLNNPQYTIYHKYFDPFLLIIFFSLFNFQISLKEKKIKNFITIYSYFFIFLLISNLKYIWTT